jgi:RNA polymerase primary sigma factor
VRQLKIASDKITKRTDNTSRYFNEVDRRTLLSTEEEFRVGQLAQQGDEAAIEKLISANLRFVISVAKQYSGTGVLLDDLICQGNIGLCDAARTFDPSRGFKFISYAVWHIRKEILSYLNSDYRTVRVPQNVLNDLVKIRRADESIIQVEGRYGTVDELHSELTRRGYDMSINQINRISQADSKNVPLESNEIDPDRSSPIDWLNSDSNPTDNLDKLDLEKSISMALNQLTPMQKDIVCRRLGIGYPEIEAFSTISGRYGKSPEWARQIYTKSIRLLKVKLRRAKLTYGQIVA